MNVILTHEQADFDALAAMLAASLLHGRAFPVLPHRMNRNVRAFINLYGAELPFIESRDLPAQNIESVTLVDTQSLVTLKGLTRRTRVHVVDHHQIKPDLPANWTVTVDRTGACTTIFMDELRDRNGNLSLVQASLLLLGIYEDTGSLSFTSTTARDVRAAAYLLEQGASLRIASEFLNPPLSEEQQALSDQLLSSAKTVSIHGRRIVFASADATTLNEEISSVAHKLRDLIDPDALLLVVDTSEGIRLVARSTSDSIDVAAIAALYGGGGHARASAALIHPSKEGFANAAALIEDMAARLPSFVTPSITVGQIMSRKPTLLAPETSLAEASRLMQRYGYEGYPVVQDGRVVGLLNRRSVDRAQAHKLNLNTASLMEAGEIQVSPQDTLEYLQKLMAETGWGQVPVVDPKTGSIIGIVTRTDLLKTLATGESQLPGRQNLTARLEAALPHARVALLKLVADLAHEKHLPVYIVGGFVRDLLLDRPSLDFDIVVEGDAIALGRELAHRYHGRVITHARFGTAKWKIDEIRTRLAAQLNNGLPSSPKELPESLDLISARTEFYDYPTALPTVERSSIKLDLHRRDFTINTIALRLDGRHYGDLYDYYGGLSDLNKGLVRVLHSLSFIDDPTRMLRAVRFEQRFGFEIEERTRQLMDEAREMLRQVSGERLRHEIDLILDEKDPIPALHRMEDLELLSAIHPDLHWTDGLDTPLRNVLFEPLADNWALPDPLGNCPRRKALAYLLWLLTLPAESAWEIARRLRLPSTLIKALASGFALNDRLNDLKQQPPSRIVDAFDDVSRLALYALYLTQADLQIKQVFVDYIQSWQYVKAQYDGTRLKEKGIPPGPHYSQILHDLRSAWLDGQVSTGDEEQALLDRLLRNS